DREQYDAERRDRGADRVLAPYAVTEIRHSKTDREKYLQLNHERREARGHSELHAQEQQPELAEADREPVGDNVAQRHSRRLDEKHQRNRGEKEAHGDERERRDLVQADLDRHERKSPQR